MGTKIEDATAITGGALITGDVVPVSRADDSKGKFDLSLLPMWPQTPGELDQSITPSDYRYPEGNVKRYGAVGDGVTNDLPAFNKAVACYSLYDAVQAPSG